MPLEHPPRGDLVNRHLLRVDLVNQLLEDLVRLLLLLGVCLAVVSHTSQCMCFICSLYFILSLSNNYVTFTILAPAAAPFGSPAPAPAFGAKPSGGLFGAAAPGKFFMDNFVY